MKRTNGIVNNCGKWRHSHIHMYVSESCEVGAPQNEVRLSKVSEYEFSVLRSNVIANCWRSLKRLNTIPYQRQQKKATTKFTVIAEEATSFFATQQLIYILDAISTLAKQSWFAKRIEKLDCADHSPAAL